MVFGKDVKNLLQFTHEQTKKNRNFMGILTFKSIIYGMIYRFEAWHSIYRLRFRILYSFASFVMHRSIPPVFKIVFFLVLLFATKLHRAEQNEWENRNSCNTQTVYFDCCNRCSGLQSARFVQPLPKHAYGQYHISTSTIDSYYLKRFINGFIVFNAFRKNSNTETELAFFGCWIIF